MQVQDPGVISVTAGIDQCVQTPAPVKKSSCPAFCGMTNEACADNGDFVREIYARPIMKKSNVYYSRGSRRWCIE